MFLVLPSLLQRHDVKDEADTSELELIEAAKANTCAFALLYEKYAQRVYRYTRTRIHNEDDAADLTQQTFLNAMHALPRYKSQGIPFVAWLFRIALYTIRQKQRKERIMVSWDLLPEALHPQGAGDPEGVLLQQERLKRVEVLFESLKSSQQELLTLRFAGGLTSNEIAAVLM